MKQCFSVSQISYGLGGVDEIQLDNREYYDYDWVDIHNKDNTIINTKLEHNELRPHYHNNRPFRDVIKPLKTSHVSSIMRTLPPVSGTQIYYLSLQCSIQIGRYSHHT